MPTALEYVGEVGVARHRIVQPLRDFLQCLLLRFGYGDERRNAEFARGMLKQDARADEGNKHVAGNQRPGGAIPARSIRSIGFPFLDSTRSVNPHSTLLRIYDLSRSPAAVTMPPLRN